jgi:hypothetical protein
VAVDTVLVGTPGSRAERSGGADRRFLEDLALATGGRFRDATRARR